MLALLKPQVLDSEHTQQFDRWKDKDVQLQKQKQIKNKTKLGRARTLNNNMTTQLGL